MAETSYTDLSLNLIAATKSLFPNNKVIFGNLGKPEPDNAYVVIRVIRDSQNGVAQTATLLNLSNQMNTLVNYEALVQFSFLSTEDDTAANLAKYFIQYLNTPLTREIFRANNLSKLSVSPIRNVTNPRESTWTQHYNVDVTFVYSILTQQTTIPITVVQVSDEISGTVFTVPPDVIIP